MDEGHCGLPTGELIPLTEKLLEDPQGLIHTALDLERQEGSVIADRIGETDCTFFPGLHGAERAVAAYPRQAAHCSGPSSTQRRPCPG
jgi:exodeoxyribonuclease V alpha subunit